MNLGKAKDKESLGRFDQYVLLRLSQIGAGQHMKTNIEQLVASMSIGQRNSLRLAVQSATGVHDLLLALMETQVEAKTWQFTPAAETVVSKTILMFRAALARN
jgi:hypothetical protein